jgi:C4-dicarboxylate transporter
MVVQMYFFRYVASKQYETVLLSKANIIELYVSKVPSYKDKFINDSERYKKENKEKIENQKRERETVNNSLEFKYCWLPIIITSIVSVLVLLYSNTKWSKYHTIGMIFIILGYISELLFFFTMVKQYEFIGDYKILDEIVEKIKGVR